VRGKLPETGYLTPPQKTTVAAKCGVSSQFQSFTRHVLRGELEANVRRADVVELLGHDVLREFGLVAFAAQVGKVKIFQFRRHDLRGGFGGGHVREMAVAAEDALFERPRAARTILQHLHVVVGFEDEDVRGADAVEHELGGVAEVGGEADVAARGAQKKSDGVLRVVRDGKGFDEDIGDLKARAGGEKVAVEFGFEAELESVLRVAVTVNGNI
jgi:hypothetical protein